jgi:predicted PurR-regulated permease PerM
LVTYLQRAAPLPSKQVTFILGEARNGLSAVFVGQILTSMIQGALGGVGFLIAGLPGAIIWAAVMAVLSLLPIIGAFAVWIPAAIFLFATGQIWQAGFLVVWGVVVVGQVDNFLRPKLIGDRADIHPIFVLIGVLGGVAAFGFIGLFLGPLIVGVTLSILKVWETDYLDPQVGARDPTADEQ